MIFANTGTRMVRPFLALYILALGGSVAQAGIFFTLDTVASTLFRPLGGWVSDSIGRLQSVGIGTIFGFLGYLGYALSPTWGWLIVATVLLAGGRALVGPSFRAFTAEAAPAGRTAETFGLVNGLFAICKVAGPLLGGWLVSQYGLRPMFGAAVGFMGIASVMRVATALGQPFAWGELRGWSLRLSLKKMLVGMVAGGVLTWLLVTDGLADFGASLGENLRPVYLEGYGITEGTIGLLFALQAGIYLLVNLFGSRLADRMPTRVLAMGRLLQAISLVVLIVSPSSLTFVIHFILDGIAYGLGDPAFDAMLARSAPQGSMGMTFGLFRTTISFASMPAPYLGGLLWEGYSPEVPFWIGSVIVLIASVLVWTVLEKKFTGR